MRVSWVYGGLFQGGIRVQVLGFRLMYRGEACAANRGPFEASKSKDCSACTFLPEETKC